MGLKQQQRMDVLLTRRALLQTAVGGVATAMLAACGGQPVPTRPATTVSTLKSVKRGGTLKVGIQFDPTSLDPHGSIFTATDRVTEQVYSRLVSLDAALQPQPDLAESWEIAPEGTVYTFHLRHNIRFHDGRPLTAADVQYSFQRILDPATRSQSTFYLSRAQAIDAVDDFTLRITLETPNASLLTGLASPGHSIVPREDAGVVAPDLSKTANGTGPFRLVEYVPNVRVVLERNPNYWNPDQPYLDRIEMMPLTDDATRVSTLQQGTVDFIENLTGKFVQLLRDRSDLVLAGNQNTNIRYLGFNLTKPDVPWANRDVREAITIALDRKAIVQAAYNGEATPTVAIFRPDYWAAYPAPVPAADVRRAKQLLAGAGYPNGFPVQIITWAAWTALTNIAYIVRDQLQAIGIVADVVLRNDDELLRDSKAKTYEMIVSGVSGFVDPNDVLYSSFDIGLDSNSSGYDNPEVPRLLSDGLATVSLADRRKAYQLLQQTLLNDNPWAMLCSEHRYEAMQATVVGFTHMPTGALTALQTTFLDR